MGQLAAGVLGEVTSNSTSRFRERQPHLEGTRAGARQRLLEDPVDAEVDARRLRPRVSGDLELDLAVLLTSALYHPVNLAHSRLRRQLGRLVHPPQDAQDAAHLRQGLAAGFLDGRHRCVRAIEIVIEQLLRGFGLHDHRADAARDHGVELAGDSRSFVGDRQELATRSAAIRSALRPSSSFSSRRARRACPTAQDAATTLVGNA